VIANDTDGDPVKFSIKSQPTWGSITIFNSDTGDAIYKTPNYCEGCTDKFSFQVTDDHNTTSNAAYVSVHINAPSEGPTGVEQS
jgi:hypothetical protein